MIAIMTATTEEKTVPPTEVTAKAKRRAFTAEYKRRILRRADACTQPGEIGALLRGEGLYSSHLSDWRTARERGELAELGKRRGPRARPKDERDQRIKELERDNARLEKRALRAEVLVDLQKKVAELLGMAFPDPDEKR
mgnify:FL=1